jgi:hypothetical protein
MLMKIKAAETAWMKRVTKGTAVMLVAAASAMSAEYALAQSSTDSTAQPMTHADRKAERAQAKADKKARVAQAKADKKKVEAQADADEAKAKANVKDAKDQ